MRQTDRWYHVTCSGTGPEGPACPTRPTWRVTNRRTRTWDYVTDGFSQQYACDGDLEAQLDRPYESACEPLDDETIAGSPLFESRIPGTPPSDAGAWMVARAHKLVAMTKGLSLSAAYDQAVREWFLGHPEP